MSFSLRDLQVLLAVVDVALDARSLGDFRRSQRARYSLHRQVLSVRRRVSVASSRFEPASNDAHSHKKTGG